MSVKEELLSVGIDLGTSTTQLIFSRLLIENMASSFSVPRMEITKKEIQYKSDIYFTPMKDQTTIDFPAIRGIVEKEYQKAGVRKEDIDTGAVIITGETARKENAREVVNALSGFAGDFVVATAGPDLESVISGKGAGTDVYSREHRLTAVNIDIGGGTSNLAVFCRGDTVDTGCLDVGGRLIKVDKDTGRIYYISPKLQKIIEAEGLGLCVGETFRTEAVIPLIGILVEALEQSVGLREDSKYYKLLITNHGLRNKDISHISFSGGVAAVLYRPENYPDPLQFGDIGILLAKEIGKSRLFSHLQVIESAETIRATVVGAGSHTTEISGSTITYANVTFPIKNLPVLKLSFEEQQEGRLAETLRRKMSWFWAEGQPVQIAVALDGERNPSFDRIVTYAGELTEGLKPLRQAGFIAVVVVAEDMAKVLGQTIRCMTGEAGTIVCLDGIRLNEGDYIDIGRPAAEGAVLPVVVKTLVFQK